MDGGLRIHRFEARHRVPDAAGRRLALDAQARLLDGELEAALARVAAPDEVVLVRRLSARVRLSSRGSDRDNARAWSDALALSLARALEQAGTPGLLRFASRAHALRAFVADALQGESARDWAWQRLQLLPPTRERTQGAAQRRQALLRLLADDAEHSVPLLRSLLFGAHWPALVAQLHEGELRGLAQSVLLRLAGVGAVAFADGPAPAAAATTPAGAAAGASPAADAVAAPPPWMASTLASAATPRRALWALRLATLLAAPALARRSAAAVDLQWQAWSAAAGRPLSDLPLPPRDPAASRSPTAAVTREAIHATLPARPGDAAIATGARAPAAEPPTPGADRPLLTRATPEGRLPDAPAEAPAPADAPAAVGRTRHGGLAFLLPLLPQCGALPLLDDPALWPDLPQALHRFALALWPMAGDDAAALAFCGLAPGQEPPPAQDLGAPQQAALAAARALLLDHLEARLPDWRGPALLARVVCRDARVSADPGWIDVHFALRDVSIELRRAALDLDPGFLPWLGVVLRYVYE